MTPIPEPAADLLAQLAAVLSPTHPKRAMLIVPSSGVYVRTRPEGTLITTDKTLADHFGHAADDVTMAAILGYPEHKADVVKNCGGEPLRAVAVQARDANGNVITEAFASPVGLEQTVNALQPHVPEGGMLMILSPLDAIARRFARCAQERVPHE